MLETHVFKVWAGGTGYYYKYDREYRDAYNQGRVLSTDDNKWCFTGAPFSIDNNVSTCFNSTEMGEAVKAKRKEYLDLWREEWNMKKSVAELIEKALNATREAEKQGS